MNKLSAHLLVLGLALLAGCSSASDTGLAQFAVSAPLALSASISRVSVTASAADFSSVSVELVSSNGSWGGVLGNIPVGTNRSFLAQAFDSSNTLLFQGSASGVSIAAGQTSLVAITLQQLAPVPPYSNEAPLIDSLVASATSVQPGASLSLTAEVHDPNTGDTLSLAWTASGGSFSVPTAAATTWTAPSSIGVQTLTLTVTDSQGAAVSVSLAVNVASGSATTGNATFDLSFNRWPVVSRVSASLNRLDAGQSTSLSAIGSDADGDALSYQWTASCPGTWTNASSSSASFVPSSVPASACNNCRLTLTVQDGRGGQATGSLNLCIASASIERFAPLFTNSYQSSASVSPGQTVSFDVTAMDPQSSSLAFTWSANTGSLATAQSTAATSSVVWTAPSCLQPGVTPSVTATVTNAFGLSASRSSPLSGLPACVAAWSSAGSMSTGREEFTATLLPSGKVLVAGGLSSSIALASAELYDPATHSWASAGSMAASRYAQTATLLPSGKVLILGGRFSSTGYRAQAELYDPATHSWASAAPMASARGYHTATLLSSGKVLVTGGVSSTALSSSELYDPATNSWAPATALATARYGHTATLLPSGKVLVAGGYHGGFPSSAELYDPATHSWSSAGSLAVARGAHTATLLSSGKVLIAGGYNGSYLSPAELYDPATNSWSSASSLAVARRNPTAILLSSGKVLVSGGYNGTYLSSAELYDPATHSWSSTAPMASGRQFHAATLLSSGKVLAAGGTQGSALSSAELYTP
jgi:hypothetical protein